MQILMSENGHEHEHLPDRTISREGNGYLRRKIQTWLLVFLWSRIGKDLVHGCDVPAPPGPPECAVDVQTVASTLRSSDHRFHGFLGRAQEHTQPQYLVLLQRAREGHLLRHVDVVRG